VQEATAQILTEWESFYIIIGAAAGALTGLTFVVITLVTDIQQRRGADAAIAAFTTPTIVHFGAVLLITAILSAPWRVLWPLGLLLGAAGLGGVGYVLIILRRARRQDAYQPVLEDWLWHIIFPFMAYISLVIVMIALPSRPVSSLFVVAIVSTLLLFVGIHNSWDNITYIATQGIQTENKSQDQTGD
jgi:hypothetical protein